MTGPAAASVVSVGRIRSRLGRMTPSAPASSHSPTKRDMVSGRARTTCRIPTGTTTTNARLLANRVAVYLRDTLHVIERHAAPGLLQRADGHQSIDEDKAALT